MRILLVEDDTMIGESTRDGLRKEGLAVDWVRDARDAELALASGVYEFLLLDLGLPGKSGLHLLREQRRDGNSIPVLILTARDSIDDRVAGLDAGSDDYVVKPFDLAEVAARIRALWRRRLGRTHPRIQLGELVLDPRSREVLHRGIPVALAVKEFAVLQMLVESPGTVFTREQIEERLYGWNEEVESNTVEVHVHHLRRKLGRNAIRTIRGVGYAMGDVS